MRRQVKYENLEDRNLLTFAFNYQVVDLPIDKSHSTVDMEVVDLNGDAHLDLIVATHTFGSSHIDALLATGSGYELVSRELLADQVLSTSQVDLNGDGNIDLVAHTSQEIVSYLDKGKSDQGWLGLESANRKALDDVWKLEPANINGDQFGDLVVGVADEIHVMLGSGDGTFSDGSRISLSDYRPAIPEGVNLRQVSDQRSLDVGDINSDGFDDFVVSSANGFSNLAGWRLQGVVVSFINDGQASFISEVYEGDAGSVFLEDVDRDGDLDFLVSTFDRPIDEFLGSRVLVGDGDGSFSFNEADCCVIGRDRITGADGTRLYNLEGIWIGGDALFFENENVAIDLRPWNDWFRTSTTQIIDLDSDGIEDIVGLDERSIAVLNRTDPSPLTEFVPTQIRAGERSGKFVDDFDLDGHADIVALEPSDSQTNKFTAHIRWGTPLGPAEIVDSIELELGEINPYFDFDLVLGKIKDVNDDGFPDIRVRVRGGISDILNSTDRVFQVGPFEPNGDSRFPFHDSEIPEESPAWPTKPPVVANGDINGDGFPEKVSVHETWYDGLLTIQQGVSESEVEDVGVTQVFSKPIDWEFDHFQKTVQLWDMTGDGILDVVYSDFATADVLVFAGISDQATGDVNRDSKVDFADFLILSENFGKEVASWSDGDFDGDSKVGFSDFLILSTNFDA